MIEAAVATAIRTVLHETGRDSASIGRHMLLATDLGLDSLDLAQTIVLLERSLGVDPFRGPETEPRRSIRTVADLVSLYSRALGTDTP